MYLKFTSNILLHENEAFAIVESANISREEMALLPKSVVGIYLETDDLSIIPSLMAIPTSVLCVTFNTNLNSEHCKNFLLQYIPPHLEVYFGAEIIRERLIQTPISYSLEEVRAIGQNKSQNKRPIRDVEPNEQPPLKMAAKLGMNFFPSVNQMECEETPRNEEMYRMDLT